MSLRCLILTYSYPLYATRYTLLSVDHLRRGGLKNLNIFERFQTFHINFRMFRISFRTFPNLFRTFFQKHAHLIDAVASYQPEIQHLLRTPPEIFLYQPHFSKIPFSKPQKTTAHLIENIESFRPAQEGKISGDWIAGKRYLATPLLVLLSEQGFAFAVLRAIK